MNERRRERVAAFVREVMPEFFQRECELLPGVFITVLHVEVAGSGVRANVFVGVFPDDARPGVAKSLKMRENKATQFIRKRLGTKHSPAVRFTVH